MYLKSLKAGFFLVLFNGATFIAPSAALAAGNKTVVPPSLLSCDESMKAEFHPDDKTTVVLVEKVMKGQPFPNATMEQFVYPKVPTIYGANLCHVKLLVGPGNTGAADAPSTSRGIGIEIWLPEKSIWNGRFHAIGGSGSTGSNELATDKISEWTAAIDTRAAPRVAAEEGAVTSTSDSGRGDDRSDSSWMYPDGAINFFAIRDWNYRSLYEQAVKTKALARAYYGIAPKHSYFDGASGGGRQAFHVVQNLPQQYDGVIAGIPVLAFAETMSHSYPGLVILRDLDGKAPTKEQLDFVSNAAIAACDMVGGKHLGFIVNNPGCRYDPTKDRSVLCAADGGTNNTAACLTQVQALAMNKIWYGPTRDGSVPDPAIDNGWDFPPKPNHVWYGVLRGTDLKGWVGIHSVPGMDVAALAMADSKLASPSFKNATGSGEDAWKSLTYAQFAAVFDRLEVAQPLLDISAENPDLSAFKLHGGKFLSFVHLNDSVVPPLPVINYYEHVIQNMGGLSAVQPFFKQYTVPGLAHGPQNGTPNPAANPPADRRDQLYDLLVNWVEKGKVPQQVVFTTATREDNALDPFPNAKRPQVALPTCAYPTFPGYQGGDISSASSYKCQ